MEMADQAVQVAAEAAQELLGKVIMVELLVAEAAVAVAELAQ